jgi:hypothetical protein
VDVLPLDTPRSNDINALAKLSLATADLEARWGLRFEPVEHDLGPARLALVRLSSGTIIGFARVETDSLPGVDVYQYGFRLPSEVMAELLAESGLDASEVSWTSADHP